MKVSVFKNFLNGERITACGVDELVSIIRDGDYADAISDYRCASPRMLSVGRGGEARQWAVDTADNRIPRLCFASEYRRQGGVRSLVGRNGLVLLEIDNLADFPTAVSLRNEAARQPFTMMAFVGANGRSVEVVCRVVAHDGVSDSDATAYVRMMTEGARRLHYVYSSQLGVNMHVQVQADDTMCLMSADAGVYYAPGAVAFTVDLSNPVAAYRAADVRDVDESPLPGKSRDEAYRYIFYSCWDSVLDSGLSLDDALFEERAISLLARYCCHSGLPQQMCVDRAMTLDLINRDGELITLLFNQAYGNNLVHANPTAYVPLPALTAMKTDHFMRKRFRLRRNVLTGVTQYKPLGAYDTYYRPVTQEVINAIATMAQREGIRVWARDIKERVNSELVEPYDPVNDYIASLPEWDGRDRLKAFAARVPTDNPYWTEFLLSVDALNGGSLDGARQQPWQRPCAIAHRAAGLRQDVVYKNNPAGVITAVPERPYRLQERQRRNAWPVELRPYQHRRVRPLFCTSPAAHEISILKRRRYRHKGLLPHVYNRAALCQLHRHHQQSLSADRSYR